MSFYSLMGYRTTRKMRERKRSHQLRLVNTALKLFGRGGFHATTVPQIVNKAESSTGSFYFYFRNKEDIFAAVLEQIGKKLAGVLNEAIEVHHGNTFEQMYTAIRNTFLFLSSNPNEARILLLETSGLSKRLERIRFEIIDSHERSVEKALKELDDRIPAIDFKVASQCWVGGVYEAVRKWLETRESERMSPEEVAQSVATYHFRAIGAIEFLPTYRTEGKD